MQFGAFVEILPGKEGLCHISKLSKQRVNKVTDVLKEGQQIPVKLLEVDKERWAAEAEEITAYYADNFGDKMPKELIAQLDALEARLAKC